VSTPVFADFPRWQKNISNGIRSARKEFCGIGVVQIMDGGRGGARTPDLLVANEALSQLSYTPKIETF
jgi:hypothetical protein